ncbi:MAG TPA: 3'-5' exonuclease, partial [Thermoanaerobaculia bacterium]|nr:3'-5' exonuclease [Thermoanaerobaculia bacterium]
ASLWSIIEGPLDFLPSRAAKAVREFREIVHDLQRAATNPIPEFLDYVLLRTGYRRMLQESRDLQDESRLQNIEELLNSAREFYEQNPSASLADYLDSLTLMTDLDRYEGSKGVTLMTLHAAKGLEFKVVFLAGMEEGILPHSQSSDENDDVEEERRLCYVGMTRAREQLYCMYALERRVHGMMRDQSASPFLREIPEKVTEEVRLARAGVRTGFSRPVKTGPHTGGNVTNIASFFKNAPVQFDPNLIRPARTEPKSASGELKRGARVRHAQFGDGTILTMEGSGPEAKLTVYFDRAGSKKFIAKYAKLTRI